LPRFLPVREIFGTHLHHVTGAGLCAILFFSIAAVADNPANSDIVGPIEGEAIAVQGPMTVEAGKGQVRTVLRNGSDVRVKSGQAHINLVEGGQIVICGPAHFSVLKSGKSLTIALDAGTIHAKLENEPTLTVYTPQIQAYPLSIGNGPQDVLVGVESSGNMCIRAKRGAVRIEQQLTGQSVLVPQNGDVSLANGQLESMGNANGRCECELLEAVKPRPQAATEVSQLATPEDLQKRAAEKKEPSPTTTQPPAPAKAPPQEPIYQVFMPPLQYDASKRVQTEYDPSQIVVVRKVRVRPTLILRGRVEGEMPAAQPAKAGPAAAPSASAPAAQKPPEQTTWGKVKAFFRNLWAAIH
jgi:hypothetical protein